MEAVEGVGRGDDKPQCDVALATVMEMWWTRIEPLRYASPWRFILHRALCLRVRGHLCVFFCLVHQFDQPVN